MASTRQPPRARQHHLSLVPARCCGLCGKRGSLTQTECCQQWICDDAHTYEMFSYVRNSCYVNHSRFTLCGFHYNERHRGDWKTCKQCRSAFETEIFVYYGANDYNFERLDNPPAYEPTRCSVCTKRIRLAQESYSVRGGQYVCGTCWASERPKR